MLVEKNIALHIPFKYIITNENLTLMLIYESRQSYASHFLLNTMYITSI